MIQPTGNGTSGEPNGLPAPATPGLAAGGRGPEAERTQTLRAHHTHAWAGRVLAAEEPVLAWCLADYNGTVPPDNARLDAAIAEVAPYGEAPRAGPRPEALVAFPTASRLALLLTPQRLLVFGVGLRGTPKKLLGTVPLMAVRELRAHQGHYGEQLSVVMCSGAVVDLERRDGDPVGMFVERLAELRPDDG
jgi:hypothetical protein